MTLGKNVTASGLQVLLECGGFFFGPEGEVCLDFPRAEFYGMRNIALVVIGEAES